MVFSAFSAALALAKTVSFTKNPPMTIAAMMITARMIFWAMGIVMGLLRGEASR